MSHIAKKFGGAWRLLLLSVAVFLWVSCDANDPNGPEPVMFVDITPEPDALQPGDTVRVAATARSRSGSVLNGRTFTWTSEDTAVATVSASGLVTARRAGSVVIFAVAEGKTGSLVVHVQAPQPVPVFRVDVLPEEVTADGSSVLQFSAVALDVNGMPLEREITWRSSNTAIALVDQSGLVLAVTPGTVDIIASSEGREDFGRLTVRPLPQSVARVEPVSGGVVTLFTGETQQLAVRTYAADGTELFGREVTWTSADDAIARVSANGLVEARTVGNADVVAHVEGKTASIAIDVRSRIVRIDVLPGTLVIPAGEDTLFAATARAADGAVLQRPITWVSSNPAVATIDAQGRMVAHAAGDVTIRATSEGQEGWSHVRVAPWGQRALELVGDSAPPATLFTRTAPDSAGNPRTTRFVAQSGSLNIALIGTNSGRYELLFNVWIYVEGQVIHFGQYSYRGNFSYDPFSRTFVLQSYNGLTLSMVVLPNGRARVTGRLEPNTPVQELVYRQP